MTASGIDMSTKIAKFVEQAGLGFPVRVIGAGQLTIAADNRGLLSGAPVAAEWHVGFLRIRCVEKQKKALI